jgi:EAL domain-containing protein (putative c-di-GMP-specific phosphodiesterase class I)
MGRTLFHRCVSAAASLNLQGRSSKPGPVEQYGSPLKGSGLPGRVPMTDLQVRQRPEVGTLHNSSSRHTASTPSIHEPVSDTASIDFGIAFQPIVDAAARKVISFEALVRGPRGEPASEVFACVAREELHAFDHACRLKAIRMASNLHLQTSLNLNFLPNSVQRSTEFLRLTLQASVEVGLPVERLVFEVSEMEYWQHRGSVEGMFGKCAALGFQTAIDDFGTGFSGLGRLAEYQPDYVKLDRGLVEDVHVHHVKQAIVRGICGICNQLAITPVAEGVEKVEEYRWLRQAGISLFQGFYFARPAFEALADVPAALF